MIVKGKEIIAWTRIPAVRDKVRHCAHRVQILPLAEIDEVQCRGCLTRLFAHRVLDNPPTAP